MKELNSIQTQQDFLRLAESWYNHNIQLGELSSLEIVQWLYDLGKLYQVLEVGFQQFNKVLVGPRKRKHYYNYINYLGRHSHYCDPKLYRVLKGFTWNGELKKERDLVREDWRDKKQFRKNRAKQAPWWYGHSGKKCLKHFNNKKLRQRDRQLIAHEDYDEFTKSWRIEDAWAWD